MLKSKNGREGEEGEEREEEKEEKEKVKWNQYITGIFYKSYHFGK
jgi:hypothetical protein